MIDKSQAQSVIGQTLFSSDGASVGKIGELYVDDYRGQPEWVTVNTGLFGTSESFVPLAEASMTERGVSVPYAKNAIQDAPKANEGGQLSEAEEQDLYTHYNVPYTTEGSTFADTDQLGQSTTSARNGDQVGHDTSGPTTDDAMTRSEERLNVGTERVQAGQARLRKWVETETQQVDVPVRTEKAVLVSEPITDANRGDALDGPAISEEEHEVTLTQERPVVNVETVPVERVRLSKSTEESTETVQQDVRKERIALEDETPAGTTSDKRR